MSEDTYFKAFCHDTNREFIKKGSAFVWTTSQLDWFREKYPDLEVMKKDGIYYISSETVLKKLDKKSNKGDSNE